MVYKALLVPKALPMWRALGCKSPVDVIASSLALGLTLLIVLVSLFVGHLWIVVVIYVPKTLLIWTLSLGAIPQVDVITSSLILVLRLSTILVSCCVVVI